MKTICILNLYYIYSYSILTINKLRIMEKEIALIKKSWLTFGMAPFIATGFGDNGFITECIEHPKNPNLAIIVPTGSKVTGMTEAWRRLFTPQSSKFNRDLATELNRITPRLN